MLALALALRVAHLLWFRASPFFATLTLDARYYDEWARRIADGVWIGRDAFWVDPLYAYVLSFVYRLGGHDLLLPRLVNIVFGLATAVIVWRTAWVVWRSRFAAATATLLFVLFVPGILFEGQIEKTALSVFLLAAATYLFLLPTPGPSWRPASSPGWLRWRAATPPPSCRSRRSRSRSAGIASQRTPQPPPAGSACAAPRSSSPARCR